jgi:hypothetical protein
MLANSPSSKVDVKGTFSAAAVRGLGASDTLNDVLKEQRDAVEELRKLNRRAAQGRLIFNSP